MKLKPEKFTALFFLSAIMIMFALSAYNYAFPPVNSLVIPADVKIEWDKLYPFDDGHVKAKPPVEPSFVETLKQELDKASSKNLTGYYRLVEAARKYEDILGWNIAVFNSYNPVVKLDDSYLTLFVPDGGGTEENSESVKGLADFCRQNKIEFSYINLPVKVCESEDAEISGILDYTNRNADKMLSILRESGIKCLDIRKSLHDAGMPHHKSFHVTDHHWLPKTGLWAASEMLKFLRDDFGWNVEPELLSPERFNYVVYPEWFLGSHGKKFTLARTKPDDFTMIYPKFETLIRFTVPNAGIDSEGDFGITYDMSMVEPKDYYLQNPYAAYIYADRPLIRIENRLVRNGKKILVLHESMGNCVFPFIALGVECSYSMDLRHFTGSLRKFIETERPDAVIMMYYTESPGKRGSVMYDLR